MPVGQLVRALPSIPDALGRGLAIPPPLLSPFHWRATLVPNLSDWQPGDIVLASAVGNKGRLLSAAQSLILPAATQAPWWTHCGIYLGGGSLIDAMPGARNGGVRQRSLEEYCNVRSTALLRLEIGGTFIAPAIGSQVANAATALVGNSYAMVALVALAARFFAGIAGMPQVQVRQIQRAVYCSSLVVVAYRAIDITLDMDPKVLPCLPANLHAHDNIWPIDTDWHRAV